MSRSHTVVSAVSRQRKIVTYYLPKQEFFAQGWRGRVTHALGIAEGFARNGWRVRLVSGPGVEEFAEDLPSGVQPILVGQPGRRLPEFQWRSRALRRVEALLDDSELFIVRYAISQPLHLRRLARIVRKSGSISVLEVNSLAFHHFVGPPPTLRRVLLHFESCVASNFDFLSVVSRRLHATFRLTACPTHVVTVPNATSSRTPCASSTRGADHKVCRFRYFGMYQRYYDFQLLLEAFRCLRDGTTSGEVSLHFHGTGKHEDDLVAAAHGHPAIFVHGRYDRNALPTLVSPTTDVVVLPYERGTLAKIGSPTKLFEYMALGVPILASRVGQVGRVLRDGKTAYLYEPGDLRDLVSSMNSLVGETEARQDIGRRARATCMAHHTWERRIEGFLRKIGHITNV